jgi:predicted nucleic acid-binding protein
MMHNGRAQLFERPLRVDQAIALIEGWLDQPPAVLVRAHAPPPRPRRRPASLLGDGGQLVNDAHLAALALENDATIVSFDRDFARFQGVRFLPPGED